MQTINLDPKLYELISIKDDVFKVIEKSTGKIIYISKEGKIINE